MRKPKLRKRGDLFKITEQSTGRSRTGTQTWLYHTKLAWFRAGMLWGTGGIWMVGGGFSEQHQDSAWAEPTFSGFFSQQNSERWDAYSFCIMIHLGLHPPSPICICIFSVTLCNLLLFTLSSRLCGDPNCGREWCSSNEAFEETRQSGTRGNSGCRFLFCLLAHPAPWAPGKALSRNQSRQLKLNISQQILKLCLGRGAGRLASCTRSPLSFSYLTPLTFSISLLSF